MEIKIIDKTFFRIHKNEEAIGDIWFIHPFGESGLCYIEAFKSKLIEAYNLFIPDLPGFGASPNYGNPLTVDGLYEKLKQLIEDNSETNNLFIIAHSVSGILGTRLSKYFNEKVKLYISIEGNLTTTDSYYSSLPINHNKEEFYDIFIKSVFENAQNRDDFRRYLASIQFASIDSLYKWGKSTKDYIQDDLPGKEFMELVCPKIYIWGDKDTPKETQEFIANNAIPNVFLKNIGHWPMIEIHEQFYSLINDLASNPIKKMNQLS